MIFTELKLKTTKTDGVLIDQKLDIVAHSFGYAHDLGIIQAVQEANDMGILRLEFGRFYIIAPENAGTQSSDFDKLNLSVFEQVIHYGSRRNVPREIDDYIPELQDGVAAQRAIINGVGNEKYIRAYIPPTDENQDFLNSHLEENYGWIFDILINENGWIKPKD